MNTNFDIVCVCQKHPSFYISITDDFTSRSLQTVNLTVLDNTECETALKLRSGRPHFDIPSSKLCARSSPRDSKGRKVVSSDTTLGDSGGMFICPPTIAILIP